MMNKTIHEADRDGVIVRVFHRRGEMSWVHAPGEQGSFSKIRGGGLVTIPCDCAGKASKPGQIGFRSRVPGTTFGDLSGAHSAKWITPPADAVWTL